jgi:hypothetical protein
VIPPSRIAHLWDVNRLTGSKAICSAARPKILLTSIVELLAREEACPRCLEWVVEQGQLASRRLEQRDATKEPRL